MNYPLNGSKTYLFSIVLVAVLGGLLFGYDTAVISGAEKGLQAFFLGAKDFVYTDTIHGITSSSALLGCIIGSAISGFFASYFGRKRSLAIAGVFFSFRRSAAITRNSCFLIMAFLRQVCWSLLIFIVFSAVSAWVRLGHLPDVYSRSRSFEYPRHTRVVEPVCHHLRSACSIFCQLPHPRRTHSAHH